MITFSFHSWMYWKCVILTDYFCDFITKSDCFTLLKLNEDSHYNVVNNNDEHTYLLITVMGVIT